MKAGHSALCQPEQKLNSEPTAEARNVSPACINTIELLANLNINFEISDVALIVMQLEILKAICYHFYTLYFVSLFELYIINNLFLLAKILNNMYLFLLL
jgi:hypothetical protein